MDEEKRARILQAAMLVFAKKGFEKAKVAEIAVGAGVGKGTVYEYFKSKQDILEVASVAYFDDMIKMMGRLAEVKDCWQALLALVEQTISFWDEMHELLPVVIDFWAVSLKDEDSPIGKRMKISINGMIDVVGGIIKRGQEKGRFRESVNAKYVSLLLFTMLDEGMLFNYWLKGDFSQQEYRDNCVAMLGNHLLKDLSILGN